MILDPPSFIVMQCGCEIDCNVLPKRNGERRTIHLLSPIEVRKMEVSSGAAITPPDEPQLSIEAVEGMPHWKEIEAKNVDRDNMPQVHEFVRDRRSTMKQRMRAAIDLKQTKGKVPRCWIEKNGTT